MSPTRRTRQVATALAVALLTALPACSAGSDGTSPGGATGTQEAVDAALREGGEITYWTWTPSAKAQVEAFEREFPNVRVNLVNAGTGNDHYAKLQNAVKAGSGAPDVAQVEYQALPQFALTGALVDLGRYGFRAFEDDYTPSTWHSVQVGGGLFGLPQDSGPMALFYNKEVFDRYGIAVPRTWAEYVDAARRLHAADPTRYITADTGDAGFTTSMIWQAGGRPFTTDGKSVKIDLRDEGTRRWTSTWNQLVEEELVAPITGWTDAWYRALGNGTIATLPTGAWMPGVLKASVPDGAGKWAVAPLPTYDGTPVTAENGGSAQAVLEQSGKQALAAAFVRWLDNGNGVKPFLDSGGFPATTADLGSSAFRDLAEPYFGGQRVNQVLTAAADQVAEGWSYLPYQLYANSIHADTVGKSYAGGAALDPGLVAWQQALVDYGNQQGFTVTTG
ncbi:ABC transporter substrate-binding protein [Saccharothrix syringae]|uniref:Sugar ABC transporter substrate-binding protein n=1 Tax=Saccharothrix syringae TaxID=103733 RepID=A0A5Q0H1L6_SACSY|nr:sugar ABC transporter substrate-binding protein [Saccharothrix syringae]QFZ19805.1 sugar ABC transporter substrate-binding protein [Saccharothrix syringae]